MTSEIKRRFTDTEMQTARETDLPELLTHLGYQVKRIGRYYTTAEMDSLRIKDRRTWFRYSQGIGGDAITFLQHFCNQSFPEAVEYLLTFQGRPRDAPVKTKPVTKQDKPPKEFALPPRNADDRRVFAYLRKRGIAAQVIRQFMNSGSLYEDAVHHNCVFVGRDHTGQAKYAGLRGTYDRDGKGFRGDVSGSDKDIGFATVVTGTYNRPGTYKIVYRVNGGGHRTLADNLSTQKNYTLAASATALKLASNERVTEIMFVFGQAPAGFAQVEKPYLHCKAVTGLSAGSFVNVADVGGTYGGTWVQGISRWVTTVYGKPVIPTLPKTGY